MDSIFRRGHPHFWACYHGPRGGAAPSSMAHWNYLYDLEKVLWAVCTRSQPARDALILSQINGAPLDPSARAPHCTEAMGIDATVPKDRPFPEMVTIPGLENVPDF